MLFKLQKVLKNRLRFLPETETVAIAKRIPSDQSNTSDVRVSHNTGRSPALGPVHTGREAHLCANLHANPLMLLASCVNSPIYCSVFHNLQTCCCHMLRGLCELGFTTSEWNSSPKLRPEPNEFLECPQGCGFGSMKVGDENSHQVSSPAWMTSQNSPQWPQGCGTGSIRS